MTDKNPLQALFDQLDKCMLKDRQALKKRLHSIQRRRKEGKPIEQGLDSLQQDIERSILECSTRRQNIPQIRYPEELPISKRRDDIKELIANHQVIIVAGETGSGKTTQLPKICLELGLGQRGYVGHTQPRRLAARSLAGRIAEELDSEVGKAVGFKVRFSDRTHDESYIKVMTDGILLAEMRQDRYLNQYDTIIIDEAHERSLNIDFILGYLKQLLPKRPDLKLIITSATIDTDRFSKHFNDAPVIEVSGRSYPVDIRYRPLLDNEESGTDMVQGILEAVDEISRLDRTGHILIFLPGEREIRETAEALRKHHPDKTEILPLFARLSAAEQGRIFKSSNRQRIVLATNVAETSLTVPGIRYVVDPGVARISRYSYRSKVQRLPVEAISQASANQRAGRCGRVAPGVCIRLYSEEDFVSRAEFTPPEIHRTNLASVILQMKSLGLGEVTEFPFVDAPDSRMVNDGYKLLQELGALGRQNQLTQLGRSLAKLPTDPRIGRMLLRAVDESALREVLVISAALTIQDPRERPVEKQQAADEKHQLFKDESSDFLAFYNLWDWFQGQKRELSRNKLRSLCKKHFISYLRMLEWEDIHKQLSSQLKEMGYRAESDSVDYDAIHRSILSGLLGNIALKGDEREYLGARSKKLMIFPGSSLRKKQPRWIMAAELVETSKLYARVVAKIEPEWIESLAKPLCKYSYSEPHWQKKRAQVVAFERVTLYGLPVVARRKVHFGPIDPVLSQEIFIREALVHGEYRSNAPCLKHNQKLVTDIEALESKSRRRDLLVEEQRIFDFYQQAMPVNVINGSTFERWYKTASKRDPKLLFLTEELILQRESDVSDQAYPDLLHYQGMQLQLEYHFDPNHHADGVSVKIPIALLNQLQGTYFEWLVPGMLQEKILVLIRSLPKVVRRNFVPAPDYAQACMEALNGKDRSMSLLNAVAHQLNRISGEPLPEGIWENLVIPNHLLMNFKVVDENGKVVTQGRDLAILKREYGSKISQLEIMPKEKSLRQSDIMAWTIGDIPQQIEQKTHGVMLRAYPALVDQGKNVSLMTFDTAEEAQQQHRAGLRRLFLLQVTDKAKFLNKNIPNLQRLSLCYSSLGNTDQLKQQILLATAEQSLLINDSLPYSEKEFEQYVAQGRERFLLSGNRIIALLGEVLELYHQIRLKMKGNIPPASLMAISDIQQQLKGLLWPDFISTTPLNVLENYPRYLRSILLRIEKLARNPERDRAGQLIMERVTKQYQSLPQDFSNSESISNIRWQLEELRISLFSQEVKTLMPVSEKRLLNQIKALAQNIHK